MIHSYTNITMFSNALSSPLSYEISCLVCKSSRRVDNSSYQNWQVVRSRPRVAERNPLVSYEKARELSEVKKLEPCNSGALEPRQLADVQEMTMTGPKDPVLSLN